MSCVGREIIGNEADGKAGSGARSSRAGTGKPGRRRRPVSTGEPGGQPARCHRRRAWGAPRKPPGAEPSCWGHSRRARRPYAPLTGEGGRVQTWPWALTTSQLSPSGEGTRPRTGGVRSAAEASSSSSGSSRGLGDKGVSRSEWPARVPRGEGLWHHFVGVTVQTQQNCVVRSTLTCSSSAELASLSS